MRAAAPPQPLTPDFAVLIRATTGISSIRLIDDRLVYSDRDAKVVRETPAAP
jgi:hypothetical protein